MHEHVATLVGDAGTDKQEHCGHGEHVVPRMGKKGPRHRLQRRIPYRPQLGVTLLSDLCSYTEREGDAGHSAPGTSEGEGQDGTNIGRRTETFCLSAR